MGILEAALACLPGFRPVYLRTTLGLALGSIAAPLPLTRYFGHEELDSLSMVAFLPFPFGSGLG